MKARHRANGRRALLAAIALLGAGLACAAPTPQAVRKPAPRPCTPSEPPRCESGDCTDLMLVIDRSLSTRDVWNDGTRVLEGEARAAKVLLELLGDVSLRSGVAVFSGPAADPDTGKLIGPAEPSRTEVALTDDHACVADHLDRIAAREPEGNTHTASGIDRATRELLGLRESISQYAEDRRKVTVVITDGIPTLPHGRSFEQANFRTVSRALSRAARGEVRVFVIAIGPEAAAFQLVSEDIQRTGGKLYLLLTPADLGAVVEDLALAIQGG